ncbi:MAG: methionyl-tRNA formyltransferase [Peptococcaceae bacterium BICA1-7]|nr:MAG: methionyl-tRNA formyltransferase [Peptococcaceae bacterium BICA1-7]HBV99544.1 methionyl-tRNA formyltransferase [Desulfotomaculum sp.]
MKVVFMGTPDFAVPSLKSLAGAGYDIEVVTQPDRPRGRGKKLKPSPVKEEALALGLTVHQPQKVREEGFVSLLKSISPDVIAVAAFGQILPAGILNIPPLGCVNVHSSLLPRYRGAAPIQRAIMDGEDRTGITIMKMDQGLDSGDILLQAGIKISGDDSFGTVHDRLAALGAKMLAEVLELLGEGELKGTPQDHDRATYAPIITREDEIIDWEKAVKNIKNRVRALNPWPGARTLLNGRILKIWEVREPAGGERHVPNGAFPGQVLGCFGEGLVVMCGDGPGVVTELQLQGSRKLGAGEFLRGCRIEPGTVLGRE